MDTICQQCGDEGFTNAFVYCVKCLNYAVHRYCLDVIPETFDEFVRWVCDDCEMELQTQIAADERDDSPSPPKDCKVPKIIECFSENETKKNDILEVQILTNEDVLEDKSKQSYDACTKLDVEGAESAYQRTLMQLEGKNDVHAADEAKTNETQKHDLLEVQIQTDDDVFEDSSKQSYNACSKLDVQVAESANQCTMQLEAENDEHAADERGRCEQSSSFQHLEEENVEGSLTEHIELPVGSWKENKKIKKTKKKKGKRNIIEYTTDKDQYIPGSSKQSYEETVKEDINECATLASDFTLPSKVKENKGLEQRDETCISRKPFDSDTNPGMAEHSIISSNRHSRSSKKKKITLSTPVLQKELPQNSPTQHLHENKRNLENQCADLSSEERKLGTSNDHIGNGIPEHIEELTFATLYRGRDYPRDLVVSADPGPIREPIWRGGFSILNTKYNGLDIMAHISCKACQKVYKAASQFPSCIQLEMLPKSKIWPKSFQTSAQGSDNIALFLFPSTMSCERDYDYLVEEMMYKDLALKAVVQNAELLIFTSTELPLSYWRFEGKNYIWGVFKKKKSPHSNSHSSKAKVTETPPIKKICRNQSPPSPLSNSGSCGST